MSKYETIKIKIINLIAENKVEYELKTRKLSDKEQQKLYSDTFNYYKTLLNTID